MSTLARIHEVKVRRRDDGRYERTLRGLTVDGQWMYDAAVYASRDDLLAGKDAQDAAFMLRLGGS
jgi:hypothetical protein